MSTKEFKIKPALQKILDDTLQEGEQVLWTGQRTFLLSFSEDWGEKIVVLLILLMLLPITLPALLLHLFQLNNTIYVVTNRRILIIANRRKNKVEAWQGTNLQPLTIELKERKDGIGTLIFSDSSTDYVEVPKSEKQNNQPYLLEIDLTKYSNAQKVRLKLEPHTEGTSKLQYAIILNEEASFKLEEVANARQLKELIEKTFGTTLEQPHIPLANEWPKA